MRKIPDVFQMGDILKTPLKVIKNKEHLRNCPSHRELKELCLLSVLWYVGWDAGKKSPLGVENCCPHQTSTGMFIPPLLIITKAWKQLRCPSGGKWISRWCYMEIVRYYSVQKIMSYHILKRHGGKTPYNHIRTERSQSEKVKFHPTPTL